MPMCYEDSKLCIHATLCGGSGDVDPLECGYYEPEKTCENIYNGNPVDGFVCSKCGLDMEDVSRIETGDDNSYKDYFEYEFKFCPECGSRVVDDGEE